MTQLATGYRTDAIPQRVKIDRCNDPFFLDGIQRVSARSHVLREIVGNLLIHREYSHAFPAKLVIEANRLYAENSNRPHGHGPIDPRLFSPYPKNPLIARVFKEVGGPTIESILSLIKANPHTTISLIARDLTLSTSAVEKHLAKLKRAGRLKRIGPDRGGHWEVIP